MQVVLKATASQILEGAMKPPTPQSSIRRETMRHVEKPMFLAIRLLLPHRAQNPNRAGVSNQPRLTKIDSGRLTK